MRNDAAGSQGFLHTTSFYESDDEFLDLVVPFVRDGAEAGEPVVTAFAGRNDALLDRALRGVSGVVRLTGDVHYERPASTIESYLRLFRDLLDGGAQQIRVVGDVPHPGTGSSWERWARYEAVVNRAFVHFPLWGLCPYDLRITPEEVIDDVRRTHPTVIDAGGAHLHNPGYEEPATLVRELAESLDPAPSQAADLVLFDPAPHEARGAAGVVAERATLDREQRQSVAVAVSELVSNAAEHGLPPVTVELWASPGRVVVAVRDAGAGPGDPLAGLVPGGRPGASGGHGLWVANQLCDEFVLHRTSAGFSVVVAVGGGQFRPR